MKLSQHTSSKFKKILLPVLTTLVVCFTGKKIHDCFQQQPTVKHYAEIPYSHGVLDSIDLLDNSVAFQHIMLAIDSAKVNVDIAMFEWHDDTIWNEFAKHILEAADRGVHIQIFKDMLWSYYYGEGSTFLESKFHTLLKQHPNIELRDGKDFGGPRWSQRLRNFNNHAKYIIIDGKTTHEVVFVGDMNIGDHYQHRRGYMLMLSGDWFSDDLHNYKKESRNKVHQQERTEQKKELSLKVVKNSLHWDRAKRERFIGELNIQQSIIDLMSQAKKRIRIQIAYLWDKDITKTLIQQVIDGKEVKLMIPMQADLQDDTNKKTIQSILDATQWCDNLEVYLYNEGLHAKAFIFDDKVLIGSANMNSLSTLHHWEVCAVLETSWDPKMKHVLQDLEKQFLQDIQHARLVTEQSQLSYNPVKAHIEKLYSDWID